MRIGMPYSPERCSWREMRLMRILGVWYGACGWQNGREVTDWKDAEDFAEDQLLEAFDFKNVRRLSEVDQNFPFDFMGEWVWLDEKCLIDITLRTRKPVKTKRLRTWRALGYKTFLLVVVPQRMMAIFLELEDTDRWISISKTMLRRFEEIWEETCKTKTPEHFMVDDKWRKINRHSNRLFNLPPEKLGRALKNLAKDRIVYTVMYTFGIIKIGLYNDFLRKLELAAKLESTNHEG